MVILKKYAIPIRIIYLVGIVLVATTWIGAAAPNPSFEMKNQNGMMVSGSFPIPVNDYLIATSTSGESDDPIVLYNWTINNTAGIVYNLVGSGLSQLEYPVTNTGDFSVTLQVYNSTYSGATSVQQITATDSSLSVVANFSSSVDYEVTPANVTLFDLSQTSSPILGWWWNVNGTLYNSTSPIIATNQFMTGSNLVNLSVAMIDYQYGIIGVSSVSKPVILSPLRGSTANPNAAFVAIPSEGEVPLQVTFMDQSQGVAPLSYYWTFGDTTSSIDRSPQHVYNTSGIYPVILTITDGNGLTDTAVSAVQVTNPSEIQASFMSEPIIDETGGYAFRFTDTSNMNPDSWFWQFGDGYVETQGPVITHVYAKPSDDGYTVSLTVRSGVYRDTYTQVIAVS